MAEQLSINRIIHAAVRRDVARTEQALRDLPEGDVVRARQIRTAGGGIRGAAAVLWLHCRREGKAG